MSSKKTVTVVEYELGKGPRVKEIGTDLASMQRIVGGYIERYDFGRGLALYCNEDGLMLGLPASVRVNIGGLIGRVFVGPVFVARERSGETVAIEDGDLARCIEEIEVIG